MPGTSASACAAPMPMAPPEASSRSMVPRSRAPAIGEPQDDGGDDEHQRDEADLADVLLDEVVEEQPTMTAAGTVDGDEQPGQPPVRVVVEGAIPQDGEAGRDQPQPVGPEVDEERDQRAAVEDHAEGERVDERIGPARTGPGRG